MVSMMSASESMGMPMHVGTALMFLITLRFQQSLMDKSSVFMAVFLLMYALLISDPEEIETWAVSP
uniref:Uncharacterized protein n=1 Tax=Setaria viridis TaxID=4556 RepID=A0A4U6TNP1_SETVI|nr:hypothetical protein SEVIR_7G093750v2 [Setaria viridis]